MINKIILHENVKDKEYLNEFQTMTQLKKHNIMKERAELYRDFVVNLICYIHSSYLGIEYIKSKDDIRGHFEWCFNKVISDFKNEGIIFNEIYELQEYFFEYFNTRFYGAEEIPSQRTFINFWDDIFNVKSNKEKTLFNALVEIYKVFENALNTKNILDGVV